MWRFGADSGPSLRLCIVKLSDVLKQKIAAATEKDGIEADMYMYTSRAALDVITSAGVCATQRVLHYLLIYL